MSANVQLMTALDEDAWDDLLSFIEERRVIPIIGPELLRVETDSGPRLLYDWLAEKLAARLNVDTSLLPKSDLRGLDLRSCQLHGASLHAAHISGAYFPPELSPAEIEMSVKLGTRMRYTR